MELFGFPVPTKIDPIITLRYESRSIKTIGNGFGWQLKGDAGCSLLLLVVRLYLPFYKMLTHDFRAYLYCTYR